MSITLTLIQKNVPLARWEQFVEGGSEVNRGMTYFQGKQPEKTARAIFSQLSHESVVRLLAREYGGLPELVKLELRELCNMGNASGNVRKNVQRLNDALKGALLREKHVQYVNERHETADGAQFRRHAVNPAIAGAQKKYGLAGK